MITTIKSLLLLSLLSIGIQRAFAQPNKHTILNLGKKALTEAQNRHYEKALLLNHQLIDSLSIDTNENTKAEGWILVGQVFSECAQYKSAIHSYFKAKDINEKLQNQHRLFVIHQALFTVYYKLEAYEKALSYNQQAYQLLSSLDNYDIAEKPFWENFAQCYEALHQHSEAIIWYKQLLTDAIANNNEPEQILLLNRLSLLHEKEGLYNEAIVYHHQLFNYFVKNNQNTKAIETLNNIAFNFVITKQYRKAKTAFLNAEKRMKADTFSISFKTSLYTNLGVCYQNTGEYKQATAYFLKAYALIQETKQYDKAAFTANLIALHYYKADDLFNALTYAEEALVLAKKSSNKELLANCYKTSATIMQEAEEPEKALDYYSKHLLISDSLLRNERAMQKQLRDKLEDIENNEKTLKLQIAEENMKDVLLKQLKLQAKQQEQENELLKKKADLQASEQERIQQSLLLAQQQHAALKQQQELETMAKEKQLKENELKLKEAQEQEQAKAIALLESEKEKQGLELQRQELTLEKQAEKEKRMAWMISMAGLMILLTFFFLLHTKKKNKVLSLQKKEIETKNDELNTKNEEILAQAEYLKEANEELTVKNEEISAQRDDIENKKHQIESQSNQIIASIQYAKRIQEAILPGYDNLKAVMPDHFILFKPKDIVSGDFYWTKQIGSYVYATVADCTGHGVPGAFMSMLGTAFLNEITGSREQLTPGEILDALRIKVKRSLKQVGKMGEAKDGMDMALIRLDLNSGQLMFAGAHNALIHLRNNDSETELTQLKGDRMPIGINRREDPFTNHEITLLPNDTLYLFSDGYIDQFGGDKGNKFMSGKFKTLLQEITYLSMEDQKSILEKTIEEWRGTHPQIDDICVMGIRFQEQYGELEFFEELESKEQMV